MNIDDVPLKNQFQPSDDVLGIIFGHQRELMKKYDMIERRNGAVIPDESEVHIDNARTQMRIKDMFWRTTEELAEAAEHLDEINFASWKVDWDKEVYIRHFFEEMADALHFLVEATIWSGYSHDELKTLKFFAYSSSEILQGAVFAHAAEHIQRTMWNMVLHMGLAANCLKNKPWKIRRCELTWPSSTIIFVRHGGITQSLPQISI